MQFAKGIPKSSHSIFIPKTLACPGTHVPGYPVAWVHSMHTFKFPRFNPNEQESLLLVLLLAEESNKSQGSTMTFTGYTCNRVQIPIFLAVASRRCWTRSIRPRGSPFARQQIRDGCRVSTLHPSWWVLLAKTTTNPL